MPTVRADIKPRYVFPALSGNENAKPLRIYPAEAWEKWGGEPGLFRVSIGDAWVSRKGERASFYDLEGLREVFLRWGFESMGMSAKPQPGAVLPDVPLYSFVSLWRPDDADMATRTKGHAFRDEEGDWRVFVYGVASPVPLDHLTYRKRGEGLAAPGGDDGVR
ncbi:MAG: hypothetical protein HY916_09310 [Desulfovibrio sp.]|jgi:hypothetical protein|nr:hypothetical protein [Desulfovibrio sp.]